MNRRGIVSPQVCQGRALAAAMKGEGRRVSPALREKRMDV